MSSPAELRSQCLLRLALLATNPIRCHKFQIGTLPEIPPVGLPATAVRASTIADKKKGNKQ